MKTVKINIQNGNDRNNMIIALANACIRVWVEETKDYYVTNIWVCFEIPENNIKP
jgi:hypothetical protein